MLFNTGFTNFGFCGCCYTCPGVCSASESKISVVIVGIQDTSSQLVSGSYNVSFDDGSFGGAGVTTWFKTFPWNSTHCFNERIFNSEDQIVTASLSQCDWSEAGLIITPSVDSHASSNKHSDTTFCHDGTDFSDVTDGYPSTSFYFQTFFPKQLFIEITGVANNACSSCTGIEDPPPGVSKDGWNTKYRAYFNSVSPSETIYGNECTSPCAATTCVESSGFIVGLDTFGNNIDGTFPIQLMVSIGGVESGTCEACDAGNYDKVVDLINNGSSSTCRWISSNIDTDVCDDGLGKEWWVGGNIDVQKKLTVGGFYDLTVGVSDNGISHIGPSEAFWTGIVGGNFDEYDKCLDISITPVVLDFEFSPPSDEFDSCDYTSATASISVI